LVCPRDSRYSRGVELVRYLVFPCEERVFPCLAIAN